MTKESQADNLFFLTFNGEYVEILANMDTGKENYPLVIEGYLLDQDDEYYYIGKSNNDITNAIKKIFVVNIAIVEKKSIYHQVLDGISAPETESEIN